MRKPRGHHWLFLGLAVVGLLAARVGAQAPNGINFSGTLIDVAGEPREGNFDMTFRVFSVPVEGTPLYQQTVSNVTVRRGQFSVLLGPFSDNIFAQGSGDRFVEVQVAKDTPMLPRQLLTSVPYTHRTASIDGARGGSVLGNVSVSGNVGIGTATPQARLDVAGDVKAAGNVTTSANLGIGTATPTARLDVAGDAKASGNLSVNGNVGVGTATPAQRLDVIGFVRGASGLCIAGDCRTSWPVGTLTGGGTANYLAKWTGGTTSGNSLVFDNGSAVGIATTGPTHTLTVNGTIRATGGTPIYSINNHCVNPGSLTTVTTCQTRQCLVSPVRYLNCSGQCVSVPVVTCNNALIGRLVAP